MMDVVGRQLPGDFVGRKRFDGVGTLSSGAFHHVGWVNLQVGTCKPSGLIYDQDLHL
jgi:hypothetical protein